MTGFWIAIAVLYILGFIGTLTQGTKPRKPLTEGQVLAVLVIDLLFIGFAFYQLAH